MVGRDHRRRVPDTAGVHRHGDEPGIPPGARASRRGTGPRRFDRDLGVVAWLTEPVSNGRMELMAPADSVFLFAESREHPMHVGGLSLFEPPEGAGPGFVREFTDAMVANDEFQPTFRKHPGTVMGGIAPMAWAYDDEIDVDYHIRRSALASPGRVRELLELASRLHTSLLDRHRPLWELYVVEGLDDGRFAMYSKMHHALIDGISAVKLMQRTLSADPDDREVRAMWSLPRRPRPKSGGSSPLGSLVKAAGSVVGL